MTPPSAVIRRQAEERCAALAKPAGALGRLEQLACWLAARQGRCPLGPVDNVRAVIFAGDHGVSRYGVSAYPCEVTAAMVRLFLAGGAGVAVLARQHGVQLRVLDIGVDADLDDLPAAVRRFKIRRSSGAIHLVDALTPEQARQALCAGITVAHEEISAGADLLIGGEMGIGNSTPAGALIAGGLGLPEVRSADRGDERLVVTLQH